MQNEEDGFQVFKERLEHLLPSSKGGSPSPRRSSIAKIKNVKNVFMVGDVVKARTNGMLFEGVVVGYTPNPHIIEIDFGDEIEEIDIDDCALVMNGLDYEVGDKVNACPPGAALFFVGTIVNINPDGTFDVLMDGDDEEDVERNIPADKIRKLRTGRQLVTSRWQKAFNVITAMKAFGSNTFGSNSY